jgi:hypothetical protein
LCEIAGKISRRRKDELHARAIAGGTFQDVQPAPNSLAQSLTALRLAEKILYLEINKETAATYDGGGFKGNQHTGSLVTENFSATTFAEATARLTGKTARTVSTSARRGKALGDDAQAIAGTSLDKGVEIDAPERFSAR